MKVLCLLLLAAMSAVAQPLDAFLGHWQVDPKASQGGMHTPPFFRELIFRTKGDNLTESVVRTSSSNDEPAASMIYTLGGKPTLGYAGDVEVSMTARWIEDKLAITWRAQDKSVLYRVFVLSPDHKSLTVQVYNNDNHEKPDQTVVLKKKR
jgi:hypothetical protein